MKILWKGLETKMKQIREKALFEQVESMKTSYSNVLGENIKMKNTRVGASLDYVLWSMEQNTSIMLVNGAGKLDEWWFVRVCK